LRTTRNSLLARSVVVLSTWSSGGVLRTSHISLNQSKDLLDELNGVRSLEKRWVNGGSSLSLHVQEVSLVLSISLDLSADLGKLIVGDKEMLAINELIVKV
jgi:hypothetical protein